MRETSKSSSTNGSRRMNPPLTQSKIVLCLLVVLFMAVPVMAENAHAEKEKTVNKGSASEAKELSGMSIVGNDEAPKSLYIVPWKSSEIGAETSLNALLNEKDVPVDLDVFKRQLEFYRISTGGEKQ